MKFLVVVIILIIRLISLLRSGVACPFYPILSLYFSAREHYHAVESTQYDRVTFSLIIYALCRSSLLVLEDKNDYRPLSQSF